MSRPAPTPGAAAPRAGNGRFSTEIAPVERPKVAEKAGNRAFSELSTQNRHKNQAFSKMHMANTRENRICHGPFSRFQPAR
jgi:hypothetical protein